MSSLFSISGLSAFGAPIAAIVCALATPALGQVKAVEAYYVVTTDKASLRCGDGDLFYKVAELPANTMLLVDGESAAWSRVTYPSGVGVFVRGEDVEVQGTSIKVSVPTRFRAANVGTGWTGSWKAALETELSAGTPLKMMEAIKDGDTGPILGYRVVAPEQARAFIESRAVRKASEAEVANFKGKAATTTNVTPTPAAPQPAPTQTPVPAAGSQTPTTPATVVPKAMDLTQPLTKAIEDKQNEKPVETVVAPATTPPANVTQPVTPNVTPENKPTDSNTAPVEVVQATNPEAVVSPAGAATEPAPTPVVNTPRPAAVAYDLESTFRNVMAQPVMSSEVDELIGEYDRAITSLEDGRLKQQLTRRRDVLAIRRELRDKVRAQEEARALIDADRGKVKQQLAVAEAGRIYTIAGQLQVSTVYDGSKLPLMYRVISIGGGSPRTLGYLSDNKELDLLGKVGAIIGVIGEAQIDRSLQLNVITPVRVDVLRPKGAVDMIVQEGNIPQPTPVVPTPAPALQEPAVPLE